MNISRYREMAVRWFTVLALSVLVWLVYWPALRGGFVNWDDPTHLLNNPQVRSLSWANIQVMFSHCVQATYIPLTILSFALEHAVAGFNPQMFHAVNICLHTLVTWLVYLLGVRVGLSGRAAFIAAVVFGVHPMHVEAVAWITARKDVLYGVLYMMSLSAYWSYLKNQRWGLYVTAWVFGVLSLLAKPMAISLPLILLLFDWLSGRRWDRRCVLDKLPFVGYVIPLGLMTYLAHARVPGSSLGTSILVWFWTLIFYLQKFCFPYPLSPIYHLPQPVTLTNPAYSLSLIVTGLLLYMIWRFRHKRWLVFAFSFYICSIFFLLRFDQAVDKTIVADRFMYLPSLGLCWLFGLGCDAAMRASTSIVRRVGVFVLVTLVLVAAGVTAYKQTFVWRDDMHLWNHVLTFTPHEVVAYHNRGLAYQATGERELALQDFNAAIYWKPDYAKAYLNRGMLFESIRRKDLARLDYDRAVKYAPDMAEGYLNRGVLNKEEGLLDEAMVEYNKALKADPNLAEAYSNRGSIYHARGLLEEALADFSLAIECDPFFVKAYSNRGAVRNQLLQFDLALDDFNKALSLAPNYAAAYSNRAALYQALGDDQLALADLDLAVRLDPDLMQAYYNQALVYVRLRRFVEAERNMNRVIELAPDYIDAHHLRAQVYIQSQQLDKAMDEYNYLIALNDQDGLAYLNRSVIFTTRSDFTRAIADIERAKASGFSVDQKYEGYVREVMRAGQK